MTTEKEFADHDQSVNENSQKGREEVSKAFEREDRYIVLKRKDVDAYLSQRQKDQLFQIVLDLGSCRPEPLVFVVVESDWPEYELVWKMIETRVNGIALGSNKALIDSILKRVENDLGLLRRLICE